ncbi:acylneuraminate cytidylyltransferase family protein [Maridesulfovibrio sp.]|uniref:acylneuraminate cytidylyltransferase family protein n=1 Tax=Maridesulfovibrio sp. TaxID=2795000 RepID=UPI0029CA4353|nr:acylneuraminate cytidylyltransferase family protein [Maridesulfovibrio sp.]
MNKSVCLIPARGGSKRLPRKNARKLAGHPLVAYTIMAATESGCFDSVVVSSDDKEILDIAAQYGAQIDVRPEYLAGDTIKATQVLDEFLKRPENQEKWDSICMCLPTCPLRTAQHLIDAMNIFKANKSEIPFLVGVTKYEFPPQLAMTLNEEGTVVTPNSPAAYLNTRSQDNTPTYHPNGSVYLATTEAYLEKSTFFAEKMLAHILPAEASLDIDYEYQLDIIEGFLNHKKQGELN